MKSLYFLTFSIIFSIINCYAQENIEPYIEVTKLKIIKKPTTSNPNLFYEIELYNNPIENLKSGIIAVGLSSSVEKAKKGDYDIQFNSIQINKEQLKNKNLRWEGRYKMPKVKGKYFLVAFVILNEEVSTMLIPHHFIRGPRKKICINTLDNEDCKKEASIEISDFEILKYPTPSEPTVKYSFNIYNDPIDELQKGTLEIGLTNSKEKAEQGKYDIALEKINITKKELTHTIFGYFKTSNLPKVKGVYYFALNFKLEETINGKLVTQHYYMTPEKLDIDTIGKEDDDEDNNDENNDDENNDDDLPKGKPDLIVDYMMSVNINIRPYSCNKWFNLSDAEQHGGHYTIFRNSSVDIDFNVANQGTSDAGEFYYSVYISKSRNLNDPFIFPIDVSFFAKTEEEIGPIIKHESINYNMLRLWEWGIDGIMNSIPGFTPDNPEEKFEGYIIFNLNEHLYGEYPIEELDKSNNSLAIPVTFFNKPGPQKIINYIPKKDEKLKIYNQFGKTLDTKQVEGLNPGFYILEQDNGKSFEKIYKIN